MTTGTEDVLKMARISVADVDVDHHISHYLHNIRRKKSLNLCQIRFKDILEVRRVIPDSRLVFDSPSLEGGCVIFQLSVIIPSIKLIHVQ